MAKTNLKNKNGTLVLYTGPKGAVELRADTDKETIWATQEQISQLFSIERSVVTKHIKNVLSDRELNEKSVCAKFAHTAEDGKKYLVNFYSLDLILAIGYRTNSSKAIKFRQWATKTLKEYLLKGFALDTDKIKKKTERFDDLRDAILFIESKVQGKVRGKITLKLTKELL